MRTFGRSLEPGAPFPHGPDVSEVVVSEVGDFAKQDGARIILTGPFLMFMASFDDHHIEFGVDICEVLDAIAKYQRETGAS